MQISTVPLRIKIGEWMRRVCECASCVSECFNVFKPLNSRSCRLMPLGQTRTYRSPHYSAYERVSHLLRSLSREQWDFLWRSHHSVLRIPRCAMLPTAMLCLYRQSTFPPDPSTSSRVVAPICICLSWRTSKLFKALVTKAVLLWGSLHYPARDSGTQGA